jgi:hypothetical protein
MHQHLHPFIAAKRAFTIVVRVQIFVMQQLVPAFSRSHLEQHICCLAEQVEGSSCTLSTNFANSNSATTIKSVAGLVVRAECLLLGNRRTHLLPNEFIAECEGDLRLGNQRTRLSSCLASEDEHRN